MKILMLTQYYTPEPPYRPCEMAPWLVRRGHSVRVITAYPSFPTGRVYEGYRNMRVHKETIDGVEVVRLLVYPDQSLSVLKRMLYWISVSAQAVLMAPWIGRDIDVVFVYSPPITLGLPALTTKFLHGVPYVYDVQDLYPESLTAAGVVKNSVVLSAVLRMEQLNYHHAAAVTVISEGFKQNLVGKGVPASKIHVIPNWADESTYVPGTRDQMVTKQMGFDGQFNVLYAGTMGSLQSLENVLICASMMEDMPDVHFHLVGDGVEKPALVRKAQSMHLRNVHFYDRMPAREMPQLFANADALLLHLKNDPLLSITIPSKTLAYLASGRPIIGAVEGDAASVIMDAGAGLTCRPEDPHALRNSITQLRNMPVSSREQMGKAGRESFLRRYHRDVLVDRFEELFLHVSNSRSHSC